MPWHDLTRRYSPRRGPSPHRIALWRLDGRAVRQPGHKGPVCRHLLRPGEEGSHGARLQGGRRGLASCSASIACTASGSNMAGRWRRPRGPALGRRARARKRRAAARSDDENGDRKPWHDQRGGTVSQGGPPPHRIALWRLDGRAVRQPGVLRRRRRGRCPGTI